MHILQFGFFTEMNLVAKIRCFLKPLLYHMLTSSRKDLLLVLKIKLFLKLLTACRLLGSLGLCIFLVNANQLYRTFYNKLTFY